MGGAVSSRKDKKLKTEAVGPESVSKKGLTSTTAEKSAALFDAKEETKLTALPEDKLSPKKPNDDSSTSDSSSSASTESSPLYNVPSLFRSLYEPRVVVMDLDEGTRLFDLIPDDVLMHIACYASWRVLGRLRCTNQRIRGVIMQPKLHHRLYSNLLFTVFRHELDGIYCKPQHGYKVMKFKKWPTGYSTFLSHRVTSMQSGLSN